MRIVLIGAGNLATHLGKALHGAGHDIVQVFSRTMKSASELAAALDSKPLDNLALVTSDADAYVVSVKDSALAQLLPSLCKGREDKVFFHTAGSMPMSVFEGKARHYGVLYPMQTFSKQRKLDFGVIPCFVEANNEVSRKVIEGLARQVSRKVYSLSSEDRKFLHLSAVFACNFANHCYAASQDILEQHGIPFDVMLPLIDETAAKVHALSPRQAQTGPAVRYDENVIGRQLELLSLQPLYRDIYESMSKSIHALSEK